MAKRQTGKRVKAKRSRSNKAKATMAPPPSNPYGLKDQHWRFAQEYAASSNGAKAAVAAGYSKKRARQTAARMVTNGNILRAVEELRKARDERTEISKDWVIQETRRRYDRCKADAGAIKCLELLGKATNAFPNKHEHSGRDGGPIPITLIEFGRAAISSPAKD